VLLIYAWCIMLSAGAAAINQVEVPMRVLIFTVLTIGSVAFAKHLHLFEPVLRHHYNKRTHEDELVTPDDPVFKQEEQAAKAAGIRGDVKDIGWGSQIRSYVLQPYTMVKDLRTGEETGNVDAVLDGGLDPFISAYLRWMSLGCPDRNSRTED